MQEPEGGNLFLKVFIWTVCGLIVVGGIILIWGSKIWVG
jgi:hypothetical protein